MPPPPKTVNDLRKQARKFVAAPNFFVHSEGRLNASKVHGKRSIRTSVMLVTEATLGQTNQGLMSKAFPKWYKVNATKWLKTFPIDPDLGRYSPYIISPRAIDRSPAAEERLIRDLFGDRQGGMIMFGNLDRSWCMLFGTILFQNEIDAMHFVVDHELQVSA